METAFLYDLFDRYSARLLCDKHQEKLRLAGDRLHDLEKNNKELQAQLSDQLRQPGIPFQKDNVSAIKPMPYDQEYLERSVNNLIDEYHELFNVVESIMHEKKADRRLLNMTD